MREDRRVEHKGVTPLPVLSLGFSSSKDESTMGQLWLATCKRGSLSSGISGTFGYFHM